MCWNNSKKQEVRSAEGIPMGENERVDLSQQISSVENRGAIRETFEVTKQKPQRLLCNNPSILEREGRVRIKHSIFNNKVKATR